MLAGGVYERAIGAAGPPLGGYQRRAPERTVLHELVAQHAQTIFDELRDVDGRGLPRPRSHVILRGVVVLTNLRSSRCRSRRRASHDNTNQREPEVRIHELLAR
ncbi:MAG: hypothetical protein ABI704_00660 [Kofleriaceae bacterium]